MRRDSRHASLALVDITVKAIQLIQYPAKEDRIALQILDSQLNTSARKDFTVPKLILLQHQNVVYVYLECIAGQLDSPIPLVYVRQVTFVEEEAL